MIILTDIQADHVRGETENGSQLNPIAIKGGLFILPDVVLSDENHAVHHAYLSKLPNREVSENEWLPAVE